MLNFVLYIFIIFLIIKWLIYLFEYFDKQVFILCKENNFNNNILQKLGHKIENYWPTFYLPNFDFMILYHLLHYQKEIKFLEHSITTRDNSKIRFDMYGSNFDKKPLVIIKYGINGTSNDKYILVICKMLVKSNYNVIIVNDRSVNECNNKNKLLGHFDIQDMEDSLEYINKKYPKIKKFVMGISLGGNHITKFLGETKSNYGISSACVISNPFDLLKTSYFFDKTIKGKIISTVFLRQFKGYFKKNLKLNPNYDEIYNHFQSPLVKMDKINNAFNFNSMVLKRICGYDSIYDYYEDCQSAYNVKNIKIKTLFINSLNDDASKKEFIPLNDIYNNENTILLLAKNGGHIEYFNGLKPRWWGFEVAIEYFNIYLNEENGYLENNPNLNVFESINSLK